MMQPFITRCGETLSNSSRNARAGPECQSSELARPLSRRVPSQARTIPRNRRVSKASAHGRWSMSIGWECVAAARHRVGSGCQPQICSAPHNVLLIYLNDNSSTVPKFSVDDDHSAAGSNIFANIERRDVSPALHRFLYGFVDI